MTGSTTCVLGTHHTFWCRIAQHSDVPHRPLVFPVTEYMNEANASAGVGISPCSHLCSVSNYVAAWNRPPFIESAVDLVPLLVLLLSLLCFQTHNEKATGLATEWLVETPARLAPLNPPLISHSLYSPLPSSDSMCLSVFLTISSRRTIPCLLSPCAMSLIHFLLNTHYTPPHTMAGVGLTRSGWAKCRRRPTHTTGSV